MKNCIYKWTIAFLITILIVGCRGDDEIIPEEIVSLWPQSVTSVEGFYLLNEGNMNMNMASLDYYDYTSGSYRRYIYDQANPEATLGLGDVGNDLGIYGSKLYAVINCSNKLEIMDVKTAKRLKVINIKNCRYVTFANDKAYVSAYDGSVEIGGSTVNGFVIEIDTTTMEITRKVEVGRQPEEMAIINNKLYIANSGGYSPPNYERTISVIDLASFKRIKDIDVAINLHRLKADAYGDLYVSSRGDYYNIPSKLFVIDSNTDTVKKTFDIACSNLAIAGDTAYVIGSEFSYLTSKWVINYSMIHVKNETIEEGRFLPKLLSDAIKTPYAIAVDPVSRYKYITDVGDYVSPGKLYCIDQQNNMIFSVRTGDIPAHIAFVVKNQTN